MASEACQDPSRGLWASKTGALLRPPSGCETLAARYENEQALRLQHIAIHSTQLVRRRRLKHFHKVARLGATTPRKRRAAVKRID